MTLITYLEKHNYDHAKILHISYKGEMRGVVWVDKGIVISASIKYRGSYIHGKKALFALFGVDEEGINIDESEVTEQTRVPKHAINKTINELIAWYKINKKEKPTMSDDIKNELAENICSIAGVLSCCLMTFDGQIIASNSSGDDKSEEMLTLNQNFVEIHAVTGTLGMGQTKSLTVKTESGP